MFKQILDYVPGVQDFPYESENNDTAHFWLRLVISRNSCSHAMDEFLVWPMFFVRAISLKSWMDRHASPALRGWIQRLKDLEIRELKGMIRVQERIIRQFTVILKRPRHFCRTLREEVGRELLVSMHALRELRQELRELR